MKKIEIKDGFIDVDDNNDHFVEFLSMTWNEEVFNYENALALLEILNAFTSAQFAKGIQFELNSLIFSVVEQEKHFYLRVDLPEDSQFYGKLEGKILAGRLSRILNMCSSRKGFGLRHN